MLGWQRLAVVDPCLQKYCIGCVVFMVEVMVVVVFLMAAVIVEIVVSTEGAVTMV